MNSWKNFQHCHDNTQNVLDNLAADLDHQNIKINFCMNCQNQNKILLRNFLTVVGKVFGKYRINNACSKKRSIKNFNSNLLIIDDYAKDGGPGAL